MDPEVEYSWDRKHAGDAFKTTVADILPRTRRNTLIALCVGVAYVLWRGRSPQITFDDLLAFAAVVDYAIWAATTYNRNIQMASAAYMTDLTIAAMRRYA
jgi:hypothetical protein